MPCTTYILDWEIWLLSSASKPALSVRNRIQCVRPPWQVTAVQLHYGPNQTLTRAVEGPGLVDSLWSCWAPLLRIYLPLAFRGSLWIGEFHNSADPLAILPGECGHTKHSRLLQTWGFSNSHSTAIPWLEGDNFFPLSPKDTSMVYLGLGTNSGIGTPHA